MENTKVALTGQAEAMESYVQRARRVQQRLKKYEMGVEIVTTYAGEETSISIETSPLVTLALLEMLEENLASHSIEDPPQGVTRIGPQHH